MKVFGNIDRLQEGMDYHLARHNLISANLAHVDTPGFRALDIDRKKVFEQHVQLALTSTDERHISHNKGARTSDWRVYKDPFSVAGNDGNAVNVDRESVKIASNSLRYDALTTLVADEFRRLQWAVGDAKG